MIQAAATAAPEIEITAVTILTSLSQQNVTDIGFTGSTLERATELAKLAVSGGARAIVCSPLEIVAIRNAIPSEVKIITPGIRPKDQSNNDDQKRTMDPKSALESGANFLVIGRPITAAKDPRMAAKLVLESSII
jgi:orotidine-5'-phosphate decarboxylase